MISLNQCVGHMNKYTTDYDWHYTTPLSHQANLFTAKNAKKYFANYLPTETL